MVSCSLFLNGDEHVFLFVFIEMKRRNYFQMNNRSSIHYKFKTENVNKVVTFDGNQILADELKRLIAKYEGINLELFELSLTDDSTNKSYDEGFVPKNVVVVVRRLPKENVVKMPKVK